ncbi:MAG TPA: hypothetical protein VIM18_03915, partial [Solirubrobacteraceae bacterium]
DGGGPRVRATRARTQQPKCSKRRASAGSLERFGRPATELRIASAGFGIDVALCSFHARAGHVQRDDPAPRAPGLSKCSSMR